MLRPSRDEACAELRQHAEVEARVGQLKPKRILPVYAGAYGVGSLPVAEMLQELKHRGQGQPPRCKARLTPDEI